MSYCSCGGVFPASASSCSQSRRDRTERAYSATSSQTIRRTESFQPSSATDASMRSHRLASSGRPNMAKAPFKRCAEDCVSSPLAQSAAACRPATSLSASSINSFAVCRLLEAVPGVANSVWLQLMGDARLADSDSDETSVGDPCSTAGTRGVDETPHRFACHRASNFSNPFFDNSVLQSEASPVSRTFQSPSGDVGHSRPFPNSRLQFTSTRATSCKALLVIAVPIRDSV